MPETIRNLHQPERQRRHPDSEKIFYGSIAGILLVSAVVAGARVAVYESSADNNVATKEPIPTYTVPPRESPIVTIPSPDVTANVPLSAEPSPLPHSITRHKTEHAPARHPAAAAPAETTTVMPMPLDVDEAPNSSAARTTAPRTAYTSRPPAETTSASHAEPVDDPDSIRSSRQPDNDSSSQTAAHSHEQNASTQAAEETAAADQRDQSGQ